MDYSHGEVKELISKFLDAQVQAEAEILLLKAKIKLLEEKFIHRKSNEDTSPIRASEWNI
jgi:hypothetical protein